MAVEIRALTTDELPDMMRALAYAFANMAGIPAEGEPPSVLPEWTTCALVDGRLATTFGAFPFRVRLNGKSVAMAGVTMVSTSPEFRRQGLVRQIMTRALAEQRERGQAYAILWASMGAIYQRFGYGLATTAVSYDVDRAQLAFSRGEPASGGVRLTPKDVARPLIEELHKEFARPRNLVIQRASRMWDLRLADGPGRPTHYALYYDAAGTLRGYAVVQLTSESVARGPNQVLNVVDSAALDPDAYRGLWEFFAAHDLAYRIRWERAPEDDPAPLLVLEPRELGRTTGDGVWMRITDTESALSQRPYGAAGVLSIAIRDELCPWNAGTWHVETAEGETAVRRVDSQPADLEMDVPSLAVLLAGQASATRLVRAGSVTARTPDVVATADAMFATAYAPWCPDVF